MIKKTPLAQKKLAEYKGRLAECASSIIAMLSGWRIVNRRKKTPFGEIDLICRRGNTILCIEVKYRQNQVPLSEIFTASHAQTRLSNAANLIFESIRAKEVEPLKIRLRFDIHIWTGFGRLQIYRNVALENTSWHFE